MNLYVLDPVFALYSYEAKPCNRFITTALNTFLSITNGIEMSSSTLQVARRLATTAVDDDLTTCIVVSCTYQNDGLV